MKAIFFSAAVLVAALLCGCSNPRAQVAAYSGLPVPASAADRQYLGLPAEVSSFNLEDIRCEVLVIDCFDMYCHICQTGAKHVNELYRLSQEQGLGERVKFVGLGLGDTPLEVATYKEKFSVPFPLFPDRRSTVAKKFGPVRLPNLLILRNQGGRLALVHSSPGPLLNPAGMLSHIKMALERGQTYQWTDPTQGLASTCTAGSAACRAPGVSNVSNLHATPHAPAAPGL